MSEHQIITFIDEAWVRFNRESWLDALAEKQLAGMALRKIAIESLTVGHSSTLEQLRAGVHR